MNCPNDIFLRHSYTAGDRGVQPSIIGDANEQRETDICQTWCRGIPNCVAVTIKRTDHSPSYYQCYIHKDIEDIAERNRQSNSHATLYIRQICGGYKWYIFIIVKIFGW